MAYTLYNVPKYRTYPGLRLEAVNAIHTKEIRTSTYNTADEFQLRCFCSGHVSKVKQDSRKEGYTQMNSI